jgi:hypothetical protein
MWMERFGGVEAREVPWVSLCPLGERTEGLIFVRTLCIQYMLPWTGLRRQISHSFLRRPQYVKWGTTSWKVRVWFSPVPEVSVICTSNGSEDHSASCSVSSRGCFSWDKAAGAWGCPQTSYYCRDQKWWNIPPLPHTSSWLGTALIGHRDNLTVSSCMGITGQVIKCYINLRPVQAVCIARQRWAENGVKMYKKNI